MTDRPEALSDLDADYAGIHCRDCDSAEIHVVVSLFGGNTSEVLLSCLACHTCFNWVKWQHRLPPLPALVGRDGGPTVNHVTSTHTKDR